MTTEEKAPEMGRPVKFKTPKELQEKIDEYFDGCIKDKRPFTLSGLAYALEVDRKTILNYSHKEDFFPTIKRAKLRCEQFADEQLFKNGGQVAGVIFNLKNNHDDWRDRQEIDLNPPGKSSWDDKTEAELDEIIDESDKV